MSKAGSQTGEAVGDRKNPPDFLIVVRLFFKSLLRAG